MTDELPDAMTSADLQDWGSGWRGEVSITAGTAALDGWTLTWDWPGAQQISSHWNADLTQSGTTVTASDIGWNATVAAGQTREALGFISTGPSTEAEVSCAAA